MLVKKLKLKYFEVYFKGRTYTYLTLYFDFAAGIVNNPFYQIQSNSGALHMVVQAFEHRENFLFFRLPDFGRNIPESIGYLIAMAIIIVPGILLVKSGQKKTEDKK